MIMAIPSDDLDINPFRPTEFSMPTPWRFGAHAWRTGCRAALGLIPGGLDEHAVR
jgi:hypothetical protein